LENFTNSFDHCNCLRHFFFVLDNFFLKILTHSKALNEFENNNNFLFLKPIFKEVKRFIVLETLTFTSI